MVTLRADVVEERIIEREHAALRAGLGFLRETIEEAHRLGRPELGERIARSMRWLRGDFLAHLAWEEAWLYPQLDRGGGSPWATRGLRLQHEQIRELATALEATSVIAHDRWTSEVVFRVVASLARLDALISAHMAEEEWIIFPLLDRQPPTPAQEDRGNGGPAA